MTLNPSQIKSLETLVSEHQENYQIEDYTQVDDANTSGWNSGKNHILGRVKDIVASGIHDELVTISQEYNADFEADEYTQVDDAYSSGWGSGANFIKGRVKEILTKI